jgi:hypothetical protein
MTHTRAVIICVGIVLATACDRGPTAGRGDDAASAPVPAAEPILDVEPASESSWRTGERIAYVDTRAVDLTGDGSPEQIMARADGPAYDSLVVAITIASQRGDTLWHEQWPSLLYFKYDPVAGKADSTVSRIVRDHVERLLVRDRFFMDGGLPPALSHGRSPEADMREAIRYHLAELDYRAAMDLSPADATPQQGWDRIDAATVPEARVAAVLAEVRAVPSFTYFAGGEATYALAWSERERAFVRIHSCC